MQAQKVRGQSGALIVLNIAGRKITHKLPRKGNSDHNKRATYLYDNMYEVGDIIKKKYSVTGLYFKDGPCQVIQVHETSRAAATVAIVKVIRRAKVHPDYFQEDLRTLRHDDQDRGPPSQGAERRDDMSEEQLNARGWAIELIGEKLHMEQ
ncbi:hypothetical protein CC1G_14700 [Coprinopsis cinerea okayama7|uniref:Uncharacterized protein n=1 Tax=Coprinopsis cinerea (strain Okayama-7 / 130 / ATCC MYA-4618 / FGSC 9003) TaxID=240176 RepID=D6RML4_COPC7|nr:hypothetical protein CC1G_14700 [Coprinopsis cinerea okayama7\|eukprot:XP_002911271.1 hypothetical protein CC1G_14700 [Coprinopsis cinerea okayama7\